MCATTTPSLCFEAGGSVAFPGMSRVICAATRTPGPTDNRSREIAHCGATAGIALADAVACPPSAPFADISEVLARRSPADDDRQRGGGTEDHGRGDPPA